MAKQKFTFSWFERFFYPVIDLDHGRPDKPRQRAKACMKYFVEPFIKSKQKADLRERMIACLILTAIGCLSLVITFKFLKNGCP